MFKIMTRADPVSAENLSPGSQVAAVLSLCPPFPFMQAPPSLCGHP